MINEKKFNELLNKYNKEMNMKRKAESWMDLSELKLRKKLTEEIVAKSNGENFNLVASNIADLLEKEDYRGLHEELQRVFNEFMPFVTIRTFIEKVGRYGANVVCSKTNDLKNLSYSNAMCYIRYENRLLEYLCSTEEEIEEYNKIYSKYNSDWDRITQYRKSRIKRFVVQDVSADKIKELINGNDVDTLKDTLQKMFADFIDDNHVNKFINKVKEGLNIEKLLNLHKKYRLEKFHCLLLIV